MSMLAKRSRPRRRIGSNTLYRSTSGSTSSIGQPLILIRPRPFLQYETATAVFLRPKVWTDSCRDERGRGGEKRSGETGRQNVWCCAAAPLCHSRGVLRGEVRCARAQFEADPRRRWGSAGVEGRCCACDGACWAPRRGENAGDAHHSRGVEGHEEVRLSYFR